LYARVVAKHPQHKAVAVGHAMRKLLHLAFAIWKTRRPFDAKHHTWEQPSIPEKWRLLLGLDSIASDLSVTPHP
jgi:hypothetical protein